MTEYNQKCKSYQKRAVKCGCATIFQYYLACPEWAADLQEGREAMNRGKQPGVTWPAWTAEEARLCDEHLARQANEEVKTKSWSERGNLASLQEYIPVSCTPGGHMSAEGREMHQKMKKACSTCRPLCEKGHKLQHFVVEFPSDCTWCLKPTRNFGVCVTCEPVVKIC